MLKPGSIPRLQLAILLSTFLLAIYYGLVYRPLGKQAAALDAPLTNVWQKLAGSPVNPTPTGPDLTTIHRNFEGARDSLDALHRAARNTAARLALDAETRRKMNEPFQLIDYQNERQNRISELTRLAKQQQVTMHKDVFDALPEYTAEVTQPGLLWAQLEAAHQLLSAALRCKVTQMTRLQLGSIEPHVSRESDEIFLQELPVRIEVVGSMASLAQLMSSLPRRAEELKALALPEAPTNKPPLFVRGLLLRKQSAEKPDEVSLDLKASALVYLE
jgi:hypothetical protein